VSPTGLFGGPSRRWGSILVLLFHISGGRSRTAANRLMLATRSLSKVVSVLDHTLTASTDTWIEMMAFQVGTHPWRCITAVNRCWRS